MTVIAVDLGFGWTKATNGRETIKFPSVIGPRRKLFDSTSTRNQLDRLVTGDYFVGNLAIDQSATQRFNLQKNRAATDVASVLYQTALDVIAPAECDVVTGLPLAWYWEQREDMERLVTSDDRVVSARIVPQPLGTAMSWLLDDEGEIKPHKKRLAGGAVGVIDVGMHTADYLYLQGMEPRRNYSRTTRSGVHVALKAMGDAGLDLPLYAIDAAVRDGQYRKAANEAFAQLAEHVKDEALSFWPSVPRVVLITGGGGAAIYDYLDLPRAVLTRNPQEANVRGYWRLGRRRVRRHKIKGDQGQGTGGGGPRNQGRPEPDPERRSEASAAGAPLRWRLGDKS